MKKVNKLNSIKIYDKEFKNQCKVHRQVSFGYTTTSNPVKKQIGFNPSPPGVPSLGYEKVKDPTMYSIEQAEKQKTTEYIFKRPETLLKVEGTTHTTEETKKSLENLLATNRDLYGRPLTEEQRSYFMERLKNLTATPTATPPPQPTQEMSSLEQENEFVPESKQLTQELYDVGWRIYRIGKNVYYTNPDRNITQTEYPQMKEDGPQLTPELHNAGWRTAVFNNVRKYFNVYTDSKPQLEYPSAGNINYVAVIEDHGNTYYRLPDGTITTIKPKQYSEEMFRPENLPELPQLGNFINNRLNNLLTGNQKISNEGVKDVIRDTARIILSRSGIAQYFQANSVYGNRMYLLNTSHLDELSRNELVQQYRSIISIIKDQQRNILNDYPDYDVLSTLVRINSDPSYQRVNVTADNTIVETTVDSPPEPEPTELEPEPGVSEEGVETKGPPGRTETTYANIANLEKQKASYESMIGTNRDETGRILTAQAKLRIIQKIRTIEDTIKRERQTLANITVPTDPNSKQDLRRRGLDTTVPITPERAVGYDENRIMHLQNKLSRGVDKEGNELTPERRAHLQEELLLLVEQAQGAKITPSTEENTTP